MTSYVRRKSKAFRKIGDPSMIIRTRSEGRLKQYSSTTDARAWCDEIDDRREHILDLVQANHEKVSLGKYVPIEVLISALLANKDSIIAELQKLLDECKSGKTPGTSSGPPGQSAGLQDSFVSAKGEMEVNEQGKSSCGSGKPCPKKLIQPIPIITMPTVSGISGSMCSPGLPCSKKMSDLSPSIPTILGIVCGPGLPCPKKMMCHHDETDESENAHSSTSGATSAAAADKFEEKETECYFYKKTAKKAIEQLEALHCIIDERNSLRDKLQESLCELECLKSRMKDPCAQEIEALEQEIERLRSTNTLSPTEEIVVLEKETQILRKYCTRIHQVQDENFKLQIQLKRIRELSGIPSQDIEEEQSNDPNELKSRLKELKLRFAKLNDIMDERDKLKDLVGKLESQLSKYEDLPEEVEIFRKRSFMLNEILDERDTLQKRLEQMQNLEHEIVNLKEKADRAGDLEKKVANLNLEIGHVRRKSAEEIQGITEKMNKECAMKNSDIASATDEIERLRDKAKEADLLKLERDKLKLKLLECAGGDIEKAGTSTQCSAIEDLRVERDMYKAKCEELEELECQCNLLRSQVDDYKTLDSQHGQLVNQLQENELCIKDQENEIRKLVNHIDRVSQDSTAQQDRYSHALHVMRSDLNEKKSLIAVSEELLASVEVQLKTTIRGVTSETTSLKGSVDKLQDEVTKLRNLLKEKDEKLKKMCQGSTADRERLCKEVLQKDSKIRDLEDEICGCKAENEQMQDMLFSGFEKDEHFEKMLKQSKCAVKRVAELL